MEDLMDFGDFVAIEQKRYGRDNVMYQHKVIGVLQSNTYVPIPVQWPAIEVNHGKVVDVVSCICCGLDERYAFRYKRSEINYKGQ
jgi:hypothetical protein